MVSPITIVSIVLESGSEVILVDCLEAVEITDKLRELAADQSISSIGVTLIEFTLLLFSMTVFVVLFVTGNLPWLIVTTCGSGQWFPLCPSTSTV